MKTHQQGITCGGMLRFLVVVQEELQDATVGEIERGIRLMQLLDSVNPIPRTKQLFSPQKRSEKERGGTCIVAWPVAEDGSMASNSSCRTCHGCKLRERRMEF